MASLLNSAKNIDISFIGHWEDTKDYNSVILTLQSPFDGSGHLQWANTARRNFPTDNDIIAEEEFLYQRSEPVTKQWDHRGRWFRFVYNDIPAHTLPNYTDMCLNIETMYKRDATELKVANDSQTITTVQQGDIDSAYQIVLTDSSGVKLRTTTHKTVQANFTVIHSQINHSTININGISYAKPDESSQAPQQTAQYTALFTEGVAYEVTGTTILKSDRAENTNFSPTLPFLEARSEVDSALTIIEEGSFTMDDGTIVAQRRAPSGSSNMIRLDEDEIQYRNPPMTGVFPVYSDGTPISNFDITIETDTGRFYEENGNFYFIIGQKPSTDFAPLKHEALYVTPRDSENSKLAFTVSGDQGAKSLFVGLRDNCNHNLSSTSDPTVDVSTLYIHPSNLHGYSQAGTAKVQMGAGENGTDGVALYLAAADENQGITTTFEYPTRRSGAPEGNSLSVHLVHKQGRAVDGDAPLPVTSVGNIGQASPFDISSGIEEAFSTFGSAGNAKINLVNLFLYNDGPVVTWTKLYDICSGQISQATVNFDVVSIESIAVGAIYWNRTANVQRLQGSDYNTINSANPLDIRYLEALIHHFQFYFRLGAEQTPGQIYNEINHTAVLHNNPQHRSTNGRMGTTLPSSLSVSTNTDLPVSYVESRGTAVRPEIFDDGGPFELSSREDPHPLGEFIPEFSIGSRNNQIVLTLVSINPDDGTPLYVDGQGFGPRITYKANKGYFTLNSDGNIYYRVNTPTSLDESGRIYPAGTEFTEHDNKVKLNVATPPGQRRDLKFPQGLKFERGLYFRTTVEPNYNSTISPGEDTVFVNGGYYINEPDQASTSSASGSRSLNFTVDQESQPRSLNLAEPDPVILERELDFRSETGINGVISLSYNVENETLGIGILVTQSNLQLNDIVFAYDFMGNQLNYEIDTTNYQLNQRIQAEDIEIGSDQVLDSTLTLMFEENVNLPISLATAFDGYL